MLAVDICFIQNIPFFITISRRLNLITAQNLVNRDHQSVMSAVRKVQSLYRQHGYRVDTILSDGEEAVMGMILPLGDLGIKINFASKGEQIVKSRRGFGLSSQHFHIECRVCCLFILSITVFHRLI